MPRFAQIAVFAAALFNLVPLSGADAQQSYVLNAYVGNFQDSTVSVIDTATNMVTSTFVAGYMPQGFAVTPDGSTAYVVNSGDGTVSVYDAASGTVTVTIPVGHNPTSAALTPNGALLYVGNYNDSTVSVIDTATATVSTTLTNIGGPSAIAITPDGSKAYIATFAPGVTVLDLATNSVVATFFLSAVSAQVAISPDGRTAYVTADGSITVIDTASETVTGTFTAAGGSPNGIAVSPDGREVWAVVANQGSNGPPNEVVVIDAATETIAATIPLGNSPGGVAFNADGSKAFVIVTGDANVTVIDTASRNVVDQIPTRNSTISIGAFIAPAPPASAVVAAILPGGRSVEVGTTATVYATLLNTGSATLANCNIALPGADGLTFDYQTSDPATNALTGSPDTPVSIAGNSFQTYVLYFQSSAPLSPPAPVTTGVNTVDLLFSPVAVADVIALAATASGNGVVTVPFSQNGAAAFAVASVNAGAAAALTVSTDTGDAALPIAVTLCETDPSTGQCLAPPASTVPVTIAAGATPTFSVFVTASASVPFAPGTARVFVRFLDAGGTSHGSTSVAVATD
jgi:YVTN family beta-propeller protein